MAAGAAAAGLDHPDPRRSHTEQLSDNLVALDLELSAEELDQLDTASRIELGFPHDFGGFRLAYGSTLELIDNHRPHLQVPLLNTH